MPGIKKNDPKLLKKQVNELMRRDKSALSKRMAVLDSLKEIESTNKLAPSLRTLYSKQNVELKQTASNASLNPVQELRQSDETVHQSFKDIVSTNTLPPSIRTSTSKQFDKLKQIASNAPLNPEQELKQTDKLESTNKLTLTKRRNKAVLDFFKEIESTMKLNPSNARDKAVLDFFKEFESTSKPASSRPMFIAVGDFFKGIESAIQLDPSRPRDKAVLDFFKELESMSKLAPSLRTLSSKQYDEVKRIPSNVSLNPVPELMQTDRAILDHFKGIESTTKLAPSLRTPSSKQYDEVKRKASHVSMNPIPISKIFQSDGPEHLLFLNRDSVSLRSEEETSLFKKKLSVSLPRSQHVELNTPSSVAAECITSINSDLSMQAISRAAFKDPDSSITLESSFFVPPDSDICSTESSDIDFCEVSSIKESSLNCNDKFGPRGCVCDNEAVNTLPDEDWEPVHEVGDDLKKYLKKTKEELEQSKKQLFEDCAVANRSVDDRMVRQMRILDDCLKVYQYEMEKILEAVPKDLTKENYSWTGQQMSTLLHKIYMDIKAGCVALQKLEEERIESLKKAFSDCVSSQLLTGNKSFGNIMIEMDESIKIVNEQLSENMAAICDLMSTAEAHCKATMTKNKCKLDELYILAQSYIEELLYEQSTIKDEISITRDENGSRDSSLESVTKIFSSKSVPLSVKSRVESPPSSLDETVTGYKIKRTLATKRINTVHAIDLDYVYK